MKHRFAIFSDYIWPFCYIGKGIVDKLKEEFGIEDEWMPLEIHPETPKGGVEISKRFPASTLEGMFFNLRNMGKTYGIEFNEHGILSNSHYSLAAGEFAKENGRIHEYNAEIFSAYFSKGKEIGDLDIVSKICEHIGLNKDELAKRLNEGYYDKMLNDIQNEAHIYDINSTPTFIIDDKYVIVGAQPIEVFREALLNIEKQ